MEDEGAGPPRAEGLLPYDLWMEESMRHVAAFAIAHAAEHGLPGGHHFYVSFRTDAPGVQIPDRLREKYPNEMTIVLQHQFWDLKLLEGGQAFAVGLSFGGIPATLVVPLSALTGFADPHVQFGLRFRPPTPAETQAQIEPAPEPPSGAAPDAAPDAAPEPDPAPQVVSLDAFRKRTPKGEA